MRTTRTHYEVLGLPRDATLAQIKRRYRQLVRKYHPDVAQDKATAHRLFLQIREAYECLNDTTRRRAYDATLTLDRPKPPTGRLTQQATARPQPAPSATSVSKLIKDAQWSFIQRRFNEAAGHCRAVLKIDPRNAKAYSILGDIYTAQRKTDAAIKYYSYAIQFGTSDRDTEAKLNKLIDKSVASPAARASYDIPLGNANSMTVNVVWWGIAFLLILLVWVNPGEPIEWLDRYIPYVAHWSWNLVGLMAATSAVVGMLLSINGLVNHPDEELVFEVGGSNWAVIPTGFLLLIGSGFFFLGAAALYLVLGFVQNSISKSILIVFGAVGSVVLLSSILYVPAARIEVLLFGGNVSFLSMLVGWHIGSLFKPLASY